MRPPEAVRVGAAAPPVGMGKDGAAAFDTRLQGLCGGAAVPVRERLAKVTWADLAKAK